MSLSGQCVEHCVQNHSCLMVSFNPLLQGMSHRPKILKPRDSLLFPLFRDSSYVFISPLDIVSELTDIL